MKTEAAYAYLSFKRLHSAHESAVLPRRCLDNEGGEPAFGRCDGSEAIQMLADQERDGQQ